MRDLHNVQQRTCLTRKCWRLRLPLASHAPGARHPIHSSRGNFAASNCTTHSRQQHVVDCGETLTPHSDQRIDSQNGLAYRSLGSSMILAWSGPGKKGKCLRSDAALGTKDQTIALALPQSSLREIYQTRIRRCRPVSRISTICPLHRDYHRLTIQPFAALCWFTTFPIDSTSACKDRNTAMLGQWMKEYTFQSAC